MNSCTRVDIDFTKRHIMTILNITPDSFFEGSRAQEDEQIRQRVAQAVAEGATIIDVGGYSSRPGAAEVDLEEEWLRVERGVRAVREVAPSVAVSVDTFRSEVVQRVVDRFGAVIVNDITAGEADADMFRVVAEYNLPYVAMHMRGTPQSMQSLTDYTCDITSEVVGYFEQRIAQMQEAGIRNIIIDPGFGFAKSLDQNYELMSGLREICDMGYPVLVGISRKSMIYKVLDIEPEDALSGTIALNWESLRCGASILRVHDTRAAVETLRLFEKFKSNDKSI